MHCILLKSDAVCYIWHSKECTRNQDESMEASLILLTFGGVIRGEFSRDGGSRNRGLLPIQYDHSPEQEPDQRSGVEPNGFVQFLYPSLLCHRHLYSDYMAF